MSNTLTVQKVNGLIKRSPVTFVSHKLPSGARQDRTAGLYARKARWNDSILIGFDTYGYKHNIDRKDEELNKFFEFATAEGYTFTKAKNWEREFVIEVSE